VVEIAAAVAVLECVLAHLGRYLLFFCPRLASGGRVTPERGRARSSIPCVAAGFRRPLHPLALWRCPRCLSRLRHPSLTDLLAWHGWFARVVVRGFELALKKIVLITA